MRGLRECVGGRGGVGEARTGRHKADSLPAQVESCRKALTVAAISCQRPPCAARSPMPAWCSAAAAAATAASDNAE
jgi:hypothetical protein